MKRLTRELILFGAGAVGYGAIELLWRGRTHPSMLLAGGLCFRAFSELDRALPPKALAARMASGAAVITSVELGFGCLFNIGLNQGVWDYSTLKHHLEGQVCPRYTALWALLSGAAIPLAGSLAKRIGDGSAQ